MTISSLQYSSGSIGTSYKTPNLTDATSSASRKIASGPALRTFMAIADVWSLTEEQRLRILGYPPRSTYQHWAKFARNHTDIVLDFDTLIRISLIFGIYRALGTLFSTEKEGAAWLRGPHKATVFSGKPPIELMTTGMQDDLYTTRRYLDAATMGYFGSPNEADRDFKPYTDSEISFS